MTKKTPKILCEVMPGEYLDVASAFERHPALCASFDPYGLELTGDPMREYVVDAKSGKKTALSVSGYNLRMSAANLSALIKILNAAPVNGDPLNVTVNLDMDTNASNHAHEQITRYLAEIGGNSTLSNIAAGYIYHVDSLDGLQVDAAGREYVASRITTLTGSYRQKDITTPTVRETRFIVPTPESSVMFCAKGKEKLYEFVGEEYGGYRIVKVFKPEGEALYGGVILERIEGGDD